MSGLLSWFDKSFSVHFSPDGLSGLNFEHSWGDGVAVMRFFNEMYTETRERPVVSTATTPGEAHVRSLSEAGGTRSSAQWEG